MKLHNLLDYIVMHEMWLVAHVVEFGGQLNQLAHSRDGSSLSRVLVTNDGFADAFCLWSWRAKALQLLERNETALEFERHVGRCPVLGCSANVMEEASQRPCLEKGASDPRWEVLANDGVTVAIDSQAVIVNLLWQMLLGIGLRLRHDGRVWPDAIEQDINGVCGGFVF